MSSLIIKKETRGDGSVAETPTEITAEPTELQSAVDVSNGSQPLPAHDLAGSEHNSATLAQLNAKVSDDSLQGTSEKSVANGYASLDGAGKVPTAEIPDSILGSLIFQGAWNANTNTPALASGVGTKGHYYVVSVAGTTNLDGISDWGVGDWAVFNGSIWEKVDNTDQVLSVFGRAGAVVAAQDDYTHSQLASIGTDDHHAKLHGGDHVDGTDDVPTMVGANGGAGTKGLVPAPAAGDAAAGKFLKADGTWAVPTGAAAAPVLQIRNSGTYNPPNTNWNKLTFDTTDIENDAATIEHNNITTSRIDIKVTGLYKIHFQGHFHSIVSGVTAELAVRFRLNNVSDIPGGSYFADNFQEAAKEDDTSICREVFASLTAGDFVEIEVNEAGQTLVNANHMVTAMKL
jgi:hypothetical protein